MKIHEVLCEVSMAPSTIKNFATSQASQGIRAGFEAELCFKGKLIDGGSSESEPDYSHDERADDIDDIIRFFDDGNRNYSRALRDLESTLRDEYRIWVLEQIDSDWSQVERSEIRDYFVDEEGFDIDDRALELMSEAEYPQEDAEKHQRQDTDTYIEFRDKAEKELNEKIDDAIRFEEYAYTEKKDEFERDHEDEYSERDWLREEGYRTMQDIENNYQIEWPHWTEGNDSEYENFNEESAQQLEDGLQDAIGPEFAVTVSNDYAGVPRDDVTWIIEPDSSLKADNSDDLAVEIISPPMDLNTCLEKLDSFANWAKREGAYTNKSTGFHVGVSLPDIGGQVDYVKLAMFLGDHYILQQFGRAGNTYTKHAVFELEKRLNQRLQNSEQSAQQVIQGILANMHNGLMKQAATSILSSNGDRYVTINMKSDYIEFRAMGGKNYLDNIEQTKLTIMRYAYAMNIAGNPELYKQEYAKKLYKFLNPEQRLAKPGTIDLVDLFVRYSTGTLTVQDLKQTLRIQRQHRQLRQPAQQPAPTNTQGQWGRWFIKNQQGEQIHVFSARNQEDAYAKAAEFINIASNGSALIDDFIAEPELQ